MKKTSNINNYNGDDNNSNDNDYNTDSSVETLDIMRS